jgi:hypothetical protein
VSWCQATDLPRDEKEKERPRETETYSEGRVKETENKPNQPTLIDRSTSAMDFYLACESGNCDRVSQLLHTAGAADLTLCDIVSYGLKYFSNFLERDDSTAHGLLDGTCRCGLFVVESWCRYL